MTDPGKTSKAGRLILTNEEMGVYCTRREGDYGTNALQVVFFNGMHHNVPTLDEVRARAADNL